MVFGIERNAIRRGADGAGVLCYEYDPPGPPAMLALYSFAVRGIARHRMLRLSVCVCILMALAYNLSTAKVTGYCTGTVYMYHIHVQLTLSTAV